MSMRRPIGEANEVFEEPDLKGRPVDDLEDQHLGQREEGGDEEDGVGCLDLCIRSFGLQPCEMLNAYRSKPEGWLEDIYERHVASVRGKVPPERLLEFNVKDGWEPLCEFLGLPVPDIPFPNIADSSLFIQFRRAWLFIVYAWVPCSVLLCWIVWRLLQRIMTMLFPASMKRQAKITISNDKVKSS